MIEKRQNDKHLEKEMIDDFYEGNEFYNVRTIATKDYTGLEPSPPMDEEEMEEASDLYDILGPDGRDDDQYVD